MLKPLSGKRIEVKVQKPWRGMVAFHEKYVQQAVADKLPLIISYQKERMSIPWDLVEDRLLHFSKDKFPDRFSKELYRLAYFRWYPDRQKGESKIRFEKEAKALQNKLF